MLKNFAGALLGHQVVLHWINPKKQGRIQEALNMESMDIIIGSGINKNTEKSPDKTYFVLQDLVALSLIPEGDNSHRP